jgi:PIN domain nuclease of toxin-antitoxin system
LVNLVIVYLDTHVAVWLGEGRVRRIGPKARRLLEKAQPLVSPIVLLELEFLYQINRTYVRARDILRKLEHEMGLQVCTLDFPKIVDAALDETWTRDPFDRLIVAQAKANGFAPLVSADDEIAAHYPRTVW